MIVTAYKYCPPLQKAVNLVETFAGDVVSALPKVNYMRASSSNMQRSNERFFKRIFSTYIYINTLFQLSFYIYFFYFTQHNNTVHVVFFCTEALQELVPNTGCSIPMSGEKLTGFLMFFFLIFFFQIHPFKKYQFHKRYVKVFSRLLLFVSVCVCLHVEKRLYSSVGKKGYV